MTMGTMRRARRGPAVLAAVALTAGLMSGEPAQALATAGTLTAKPTALIAGEKMVLSGVVSPKLKRTVVLQRKKGSNWVKVAQKSSAAAGSFSFSTTGLGSSTKYRVYAPAATIGGKKRSAVATPVRTVTALPQTASLALPTTAVLGAPELRHRDLQPGTRRTAGHTPASRGG